LKTTSFFVCQQPFPLSADKRLLLDEGEIMS